MHISETFSHLNGLEFMTIRKPDLWQEIREIIAAVDADNKKTRDRTHQYDPMEITAEFNRLLREVSWKEPHKALATVPTEHKWETEASEDVSIFSDNQTDFVKDRVAIEIHFRQSDFMSYDLFANHLAFYVGDQIDVGIEILPMKSLQSQMSSGVAYYEGGFYNVVRQGRGVPAVPLVLIGIEP